MAFFVPPGRHTGDFRTTGDDSGYNCAEAFGSGLPLPVTKTSAVLPIFFNQYPGMVFAAFLNIIVESLPH
jgi:hypothetical protein